MNGLDTTMTAASRSLDMIQAQFLQQTLQIAQEALASKFLPNVPLPTRKMLEKCHSSHPVCKKGQVSIKCLMSLKSAEQT